MKYWMEATLFVPGPVHKGRQCVVAGGYKLLTLSFVLAFLSRGLFPSTSSDVAERQQRWPKPPEKNSPGHLGFLQRKASNLLLCNWQESVPLELTKRKKLI